MGVIVDVVCKSCKTSWQCMIGCGLLHGTLQSVAELFPEKTKRDMMEYMGQEEFPLYDFAYELSYCEHCNSIESVPVVRIPESDKVYIGTCPVCGQEIRMIRDLSAAECPICHEATLEKHETGYWD